ncbi:MAG: hypothetical protein EON52_07350 [Actinomycetales bacterium]|nr:MAG: hypothetical protein EON52_07350 [Actinomycetales bacterium]
MSAPTPVRVVLGSGTRLGRAVLAGSQSRDVRPVATSSRPVPAPSAAELLSDSEGPVELVVCALGPVHPTEARSADDMAAFQRDLGVVAGVLDEAGDRPVSVVLVSSVIALAPGDDRRYYGGWKNLVEGELRDLVAAHGRHAGLAVLYPGRLVESGSVLHATYGRLAARIDSLLAGRSASAVVGLDARAWLAVAALRTVLRSLLPGRSAVRPPVPVSSSESRSVA